MSVSRSLFMQILYNQIYDIIDKNMSDGQMGSRTSKGCRNNIFIINAIIFGAQRSKKSQTLCLRIYYYQRMFDSLNLELDLICRYF